MRYLYFDQKHPSWVAWERIRDTVPTFSTWVRQCENRRKTMGSHNVRSWLSAVILQGLQRPELQKIAAELVEVVNTHGLAYQPMIVPEQHETMPDDLYVYSSFGF